MTLNLLIGIGGTGAKIVEAVVHASAAGLGPDNLHIALVDQDRSNGNVSRALDTMQQVREARALWRQQGAAHHIGQSDFLHTDVLPIGEGHWIPHRDQRMTLRDVLGDLGKDQSLFDLLFDRETEQALELDEGYRGRAHIGSTAITSAVEHGEDAFWTSVFDLIRQARGGDKVRLVLAGSVFGGTGASGFPTLARLIRRFLDKESIGANFALGGVLMLPYFRFDKPDDENANVARSEDLLPQTRGALRYYAALRERENVFDELMMVGWDQTFNLGYHRHGTGDQRNPALLPELVAALGACRFFDHEHEPQPGVLVTARESEGSFSWSDVPPLERDEDQVYQKLGKQLRFAAAWKFWAPILAKKQGIWRSPFARQAWYKQFGIGAIDYDRSPPDDELKAISRYVDKLIEWAASIQIYAPRANLKFNLWNVERLLDGPANYDLPQYPVRVAEAIDEEGFGQASRDILQARVPSHSLTDASWLLNQLNRGRPGEGTAGLGGIVSALHNGSAAIEAQSNGGVADGRL
jgi:hypothetical protein